MAGTTKVAARGRKGTQRERLLAGMVTCANRDGYAGASVSNTIAAARVSRPTFYDYFEDRDHCFLAALEEIQGRLLGQVRQALGACPPERALQASVAALVQFASCAPGEALFLTSRAMAAGPGALNARDRGIAEIEKLITRAHARAPAQALVADLSPRIALGGVHRLLATRLRRGEPGPKRLLEELSAWLDCYQRPAGELRWRALAASDPGPARAGPAPGALPAPSPLAPGRPGLSKEQVAANHRARILHAAAQLAERKGYNATTIADITRLAGVDGRAFYAAFADKQEAFMAVHELGVQQVMSAAAGAFFSGASWPERIWEAGRAFSGFLQENPMIAHVGFVEAYAVGPAAVQRVEDSHVTFTIFLQEGYQHRPRRNPPSQLALEAIITSIFELVYREARRRRNPRITGMVGHMAFMALAPFLGARAAERFIDAQLTEATSTDPHKHRRWSFS